MKWQRVPLSSPAKCGDPRPQILHRSHRVSAAEGVLLAPHWPAWRQPVVSATLTSPSLQHRHVHACSLISLNGCLSPFSPAHPLPGPQSRCGFCSVVCRGSAPYYCPFAGTKRKPGSWAELQSQGHLAVLPRCHPPFDLLQRAQIQHVRLSSPPREQTELWMTLQDLYSGFINFGQFYHGFHNYKMLTLGNLEMMVRYCRGA